MLEASLKREAVLSLFGTKMGTKLLNFLNVCCQQSFTIGITVACSPADPLGNAVASFTVLYDNNVPGLTSITYFASNEPFDGNLMMVKDKFAFGVVQDVVGGKTYESTLRITSSLSQIVYIIAVDSHGNYSNQIALPLVVCP